MYRFISIGILSFIFILPFALSAEEGFIGENPGLDFYSKIDEGSFKVLEKSVSRRLQETPTLDAFGKECIQSEILLKGLSTSPEILEEIEKQNYSTIYEKILQNIKNNPSLGGSISTEKFQQLTLCLADKYSTLKTQARTENNARMTISYLGLYMDGDKNNSEYDIVSDIEKINMILFSQDIKYKGTPNASAKSLADFLSNKAIPPLFIGTGSVTGSVLPGNASGSVLTGSALTGSQVSASSTSQIDELLGSTCNVASNSPVSVNDMVDENFKQELTKILSSGGGGSSNGGGYTPVVTIGGNEKNLGGTITGALTSASDFFHTMPCDSFFCIKTKMVSSSQNLLGGGKNISIEGILDKHSKILYPISESALGCEVMTNNAGSSPKKGLKLVDTLAGLKVYLAEKPQISRRDKKEASPEREAEELKDIMNCGYASVGLSTDLARSRSIGGAGFMSTRGATTDSITNKSSPLGSQGVAELTRYTDCIDSHMQMGRKSYYDSFSTDVTEIQAYTAGMLKEINNIMVILTEMNYKKTECSQ